VSSGMSVLDLEHLEETDVHQRLAQQAQKMVARGVDVIVLGCAGMVGLDTVVSNACGPGVVVIDPVKAALEMAHSLLALKTPTAKVGIYANA
jgi:allantoin racemase